jgi:hypothetical protein
MTKSTHCDTETHFSQHSGGEQEARTTQTLDRILVRNPGDSHRLSTLPLTFSDGGYP